jgi:hypothetical protein
MVDGSAVECTGLEFPGTAAAWPMGSTQRIRQTAIRL